MDRRKFVATAGTAFTVGVAGCVGGSSGIGKDVTNNVPDLEVSDVSSKVRETAFGETVVVSGMLENTGSTRLELKVVAKFFDDDGTSLGSFTQYNEIPDLEVEPETKQAFEVAYEDAMPDKVARYELVIGPSYESAGAATEAGTETAADTETTEETETTVEPALSVTTSESVTVEDWTATLTGSLTELEGYDTADCSFEWRKSGGDWNDTAVQTLEEPGDFSAELTDLDSDTEYEFHAHAETSGESADGQTVSFETREVIDESFHFGWEDGDYVTDPTWTFYHQWAEKPTIVEEAAPDGETYSLSLVSEGANRVAAKPKPTYRWDTAWVFEGLSKITSEFNNDYGEFMIVLPADGFYNSDFGTRFQFDVGKRKDKDTGLIQAKIKGDPISTSGSPATIEWEKDAWYHYKCAHDGEGLYQLKVWKDGTGEPDSYQVKAKGRVPETDENNKKSMVLQSYGQEKLHVNTAFVSYETVTNE